MPGVILSPLPSPLTTATSVAFHTNRVRTGTPITRTPVLDGTVWTVGDDGLVGRYWPTITGTTLTGTASVDLDYVDLPDNPALVVSPETVAVKARIPLPLTVEDRDTITDAILDAQDDVTTYLGVPVVPTTHTQTGRYPWPDGWDLTAHGDTPIHEITSVVPEMLEGQPTGLFTVTYAAGLDARNDPTMRPIRRYVTVHTMNSPGFVDVWKATTNPSGDVKSVSVEGQSVSFTTPTLGGGGDAGSGKPGALPTLGALDRWRVAGRRVHVAKTLVNTRFWSP